MTWKIVRSEAFERELRKHKKNKSFLSALESKIKRLRQAPETVGGWLAGELHRFKSTRIMGKFRLLFQPIPAERTVKLISIDHRKFNYDRFQPARD